MTEPTNEQLRNAQAAGKRALELVPDDYRHAVLMGLVIEELTPKTVEWMCRILFRAYSGKMLDSYKRGDDEDSDADESIQQVRRAMTLEGE